jgi:prepilin-type N-terminal cleavage/methylation domain-containing protein/prepilin-type processing-associated H-X9-DG protein
MRHKRAFTILELLMVMAIILVLVTMLLPTLGSIRMSAQRVSCQSNMRQLTGAIFAYAADNDGQLPYCNWNNSVDDNSQYCKGWLFATAQYRVGYSLAILNGPWLGLPHYPQEGAMTGTIWPYVHDLLVYHCPIDNPQFWTGTEWLTSYLFNGAECGYGGMGYSTPGLKLGQVKQTTTGVVLWEALEQRYEGQSNTGAVWNDGSSNPSEEVLADRHFQGANLSFYDGHVEWWAPSTWSTWVASGKFALN